MSHFKKAFTLIELIVVIAVIGILTAFIVVSLSNSRSAANDAVRKNDISNIYKSIVGKKAINNLSYYSGTAAIKEGETPSELESFINQFLNVIPYDPNPNKAYLYKSNGNDFSLAALLDDGTCFIKSTGANLFSSESVCQQYLVGGLGLVENLMIINGTRVDLAWNIPTGLSNPETAIICLESEEPITDLTDAPTDEEILQNGVIVAIVTDDNKYRFDPNGGYYYCQAITYDSDVVTAPGTIGSVANTSSTGFSESNASYFTSAAPSDDLGGTEGGSTPAPATAPYSIAGTSNESGGTTSANFNVEAERASGGIGNLTIVWTPGFGSTHTVVRRMTNIPPATDAPQTLAQGTEVHNERNDVDALTSPTPYSHVDTGLSEDYIYCYSAWAYDEESAAYSAGYVLACSSIPAANPSGLALVSDQDSIDLSWTKGDPSYTTLIRRIEGTTPATTQDEGIVVSNGSSSAYSDTTAVPGTNYCYSLWSVNPATGVVSEDMIYECGALYTVSTPTVFATSNPTHNSIDLSWTKGTVGDQVIIRRAIGTAPQTTSEGTEVYRNSGSSFTNSSLSATTTYCYSIWGYDSTRSQYSNSFLSDCEQTTEAPPGDLVSVIDAMENTGNGDKTAVTNYADIPVEYLEIDGSTHYTTSTNLGNSTADARMLVVRYNGDVLIDAGATITPTARKRGMFMYVDGALTVNGTISMTARGATASGDRILILTDGGTSYEIPAIGGAANTAGTNGGTGGGGNGGSTGGTAVGGSGTSYSGGAGAGGGNTGNKNGSSSGGAGGPGLSSSCGASGGAGNPGGAGGPSTGGCSSVAAQAGSAGTGGLLIIYAKTITISSTGKLSSNGSNGGLSGGNNAGGGGSGGGSINVFYQNTYTNSGSVTATGGTASTGGSSGGAGTVRNPQTNSIQAPVISANVPYSVTEQSASIDVTISNDYDKGNSAILLEWGNDMVGTYTYSTSLTDKAEGTYTMTMNNLDSLPLATTYYRITVTNSEGTSSPIIGNYQVQKSLITGVRNLNGTGNGDKSLVTAYATIPVEYVEVTGNTTYTTTPTIGNTTADARMLVMRYNGNLTINSGVTLTPQVRKRGMFLYVDGTLTVNGTISMTARGASATGARILIITSSGTSYEIPAVGGVANTAGTNGGTGGGGNGGSTGGTAVGGSGTSYSGGAGAGGGNTGNKNGSSSGGAGGPGLSSSCGASGGAGNPGGAGGPSTGGCSSVAAQAGSAGTGGLLIIYAKTITISSTGKLSSNGSNGGLSGGNNAGGGGSGGGSINVFYQNTYTNSGSVTATGGTASTGGSSGGAGTIRSIQTSN